MIEPVEPASGFSGFWRGYRDTSFCTTDSSLFSGERDSELASKYGVVCILLSLVF